MSAPTRPPAWRRYLRFWGGDPARDLDDELTFHVESLYDECIAAGMSADEARREVSRRFGSVDDIRRNCAAIDSQWESEKTMSDLAHSLAADLRQAVRQFRHSPSITITAVLCFALGIGANVAIFSIVDAVLFRSLPFPAADRLVLVGEGLPRLGTENFGVISAPEFEDYRRLDRHVFTRSAIYETRPYNLSGGSAEPERVRGLRASPGLLGVLGIAPALGHGFVAGDSAAGRPDVVILSDALWKRRFGADPRIVGRTIDIDGAPVQVVGVMPPTFRFPLPGAGGDAADVLLPYKITADFERLRGNSYNTSYIARLAPGATVAEARRAVSAIAANLPALHNYGSDWKTVADVFPLHAKAVEDVRRPLLVLLAAVVLVLLIACINVSSLLLARATARQREIAMRQALGASLGRLVQQFLLEALVLVAVGGACGVSLAIWGARALALNAPRGVLEGFEPRVDWRMLAFAAGVTVLTALLFSIVPALAQRSTRALGAALRDESRGTTSGAARQRGRRALVVTEVAFAVVLSAVAGLMVRSLILARGTDPGFDPRQAITFQIGLSETGYPSAVDVRRFEQRLIDDLGRLPGVRGVSATSNLALGTPTRSAFYVEGSPAQKVNIASSEIVYPGYFETMRIQLREGRFLGAGDVPGSLGVVVINQTLARAFFGSASAIGHRLKWGSAQGKAPFLSIVGVVADVKEDGLDRPVLPAIYFPALQQDTNVVQAFLRGVSYVVRTPGDERAMMGAIQQVVRADDPNLPIVGLRTLSDVVGVSMAEREFNTSLLAAFAALALLLASAGIYGVIAYSVAQRTREIGVRMAIGASRGDVLRLVVGQGARLAAVGVAIGLVAAFLASRLAATLLFDISPSDPLSLGGAALLLLGVAALASLVPALRASRIDPQSAIRAE